MRKTSTATRVDFVAKQASRFIRDADRRDDDQPWLAWVTPYAPHLPSTPPDRYRDAPLPAFPLTPAMQETDFSDKPDFLERAYDHDNMLATMRDDGRRSLMAVDDLVGRLMDQLKKRDEVDNTLVVFASDNGFMLGEHGGVVAKDLPYPASTRIPMMVRWPGHVRPGRTTRQLVANIDVAATLLEAARRAPAHRRPVAARPRPPRGAPDREPRLLQRGPRAAPARLPLGAHAEVPLRRVLPPRHVRPRSSASTTT